MNKNKLYLFYNNIWGEFGQGVEGKELIGACLAYNEDSAKWQARLMKLSYDKMESINSFDNDSTMFKVME